MSRLKHDVVIVGAGMVGLSLANSLADLPLSIALIETQAIPDLNQDSDNPTDWNTQDYALRVSAISPASQQVLQQAGAWDAIQCRRVSAYQRMHIWEQAPQALESLKFSAEELEVDALGWIIENRLIRASLYAAAQTHNNIHFYSPQCVQAIEVTGKQVNLDLDFGQALQTRLLVAADGANSHTRHMLDLPEVSRSYAQSGVVTRLTPKKPHQACAYQRFHAQEVLGILPLANGDCSMVWSCSDARAESLLKLSKTDLSHKVSEFSQGILGQMRVNAEVKKFPLQLLHSRQYVSERVVLCGDAAHAVHPLAGQGVNLGLADVSALSDALHAAWSKNLDLGDLSVLRSYERQRKHINVRMMSGLDALLDIFQSENPLVQQGRRLGMGLVNRIGPIKRILMQQAMGLKNL
ncbi:MAG: UbiH/UbiF/VisC/COQ6 family ubiquinone biosynthesis hydroxylase [Gammaproteobacteria bacterium]|nr:UbiH/UbiF/VisC/COQ6 family ubiquinone biosynthesis hydroxylase [Gammaproteobacteria bacterium]NNC97633.1 UbiH/UbiF/VisC/COQ6 family ubiquinone biosynthesis hydroxylase [Gammaproteobacteria bacterium]NNM14181.1 UbiH/UbiF/VisC/COQ6 family ubiquinone biosynthesis hydroxylase [Gammaproteobacteria bacterium]